MTLYSYRQEISPYIQTTIDSVKYLIQGNKKIVDQGRTISTDVYTQVLNNQTCFWLEKELL